MVFLIGLMISSCGETHVRTEFEEYGVAIAVECEVPPKREAVSLRSLKSSDAGNYDLIVKTNRINTSLLKNKIEELETLLDGYRKNNESH